VQARKAAIELEDYLRTATRLICDAGFRGGSVERIAAQLGVTKGSFYHHLGEKNELIEACFAHSQTRLSELQRKASESGLAPQESILAVLMAVARIQLDGRFPLLRTSALPAVSPEARARIIAQSKRNFRWFATELAAGISMHTIRPLDPQMSAQILGVTVNALYDLGRLYGGAISPADAELFCALAARGILSGR
jgi:AcrR family transcriptional regulator